MTQHADLRWPRPYRPTRVRRLARSGGEVIQLSGETAVQMYGRSRELSEAIALLRRTARSGEGGVLVLSGEPGIGKTMLMDAVLEQAARMGFATGLGKAEEVDQIAPGAPLLVALRSGSTPLLDRQSFTDLAGLYDQHLWLIDRVAGLLDDLATRSPLVIAIDDAHWADRLTRFALKILPGRLGGSPILWLLTVRDPSDPVLGELGTAVREGLPLVHQHLEPLSDSDMAALAVDHLGESPSGRAQQMLSGVAGNPFYAVCLLEGLVEARARGDLDDDIPDDLRRQVRARCATLTPSTRAVVKAAATLGRPFPAADGPALAGLGSGDLDLAWLAPLTEHGVLVHRGDQVVFRHDLVRQAVYADLSEDARRRLHQQCIDYLLARGDGPLAAAPHVLAVAQPGDTAAVDLLLQASDACADMDALGAADLSLRALELTDPDEARWATLAVRTIELLVSAQRGAEAVALADRTLGQTHDPSVVARVQFLAACALWPMGKVASITQRVRSALALADVPASVRTRLTAVDALAATRTAPSDVARERAEAALVEARAAGDRTAQRLALEALGEGAQNAGRHELARTYFHELRELFGDTHLAQEVRALQFVDRYADAAVLLDAARAKRTSAGLPLPVGLLVAQVWQDFNLTRLDDAEVGARTLVTQAEELGNQVAALDAHLILSAVALVRADVGAARQHWRTAARTTLADEAVTDPGLRLMDGWLTAVERDPAAGVAILHPLLDGALTSRTYWPWWPGWMRLFVELGLAAGNRGFAEQAAHVAQVGADRNPGVASFEGQALHLSGLLDGDLDRLTAAVAVLEGAPRPLLLTGALTDLGDALLAAGERRRGVAALDRAWRTLAELGVTSALPPLQRRLAAAGASRRYATDSGDRPVTGWASLTPGELRVAQLIGDGHTNRSAAAALRLSPNTVATHLRSVFAKLGVSSRVQLANALHDAPEWQRRPRQTPVDEQRDAASAAPTLRPGAERPGH